MTPETPERILTALRTPGLKTEGIFLVHEGRILVGWEEGGEPAAGVEAGG